MLHALCSPACARSEVVKDAVTVILLHLRMNVEAEQKHSKKTATVTVSALLSNLHCLQHLPTPFPPPLCAPAAVCALTSWIPVP